MVYYAVRGGLCPGVYDSWDVAKSVCNGVSGALCKKFQDRPSAAEFANVSNFGEASKASFGSLSLSSQSGRTYLEVPYAQKDEAKELGAKWDANQRKWYADSENDLPALSRWLQPPPVEFENLLRKHAVQPQPKHVSNTNVADASTNLQFGISSFSSTPERTYLDVPYEQKDVAKSLGAKWDPNKRKWYADSEQVLPGLSKYRPDLPQKDELALYTDGACKGNRQVASNACPAGWGVVIVDTGSDCCTSIVAELFGPVVVDSASSFFLGAEVCSNNTGELSAICEALLWLLHHEPSGRPAAILYDSEYAAKITTGKYRAQKNQALASMARSLLDEVRQQRSVRFEHVKGHSKNKWNDAADALANRGAAPATCTVGRYSKREFEGLLELPSAKRARLGNA